MTPLIPEKNALDAANSLIRGRRTLKQALMDPERPVAREILDAMLENANRAPTHGLTEPWRFFIFQGEARARLAAGLMELYERTTPEGECRPDKHAKLGQTPLQAALVMAICLHRQDSGKIPEHEEIAAVACAVQNMHLTASAVGLGAKWSSPPVCFTPEMNGWLGLRPQDRCLGLFYVGWPREGVFFPDSPRHPVGEKVTWM
jgi:nitroreductase